MPISACATKKFDISESFKLCPASTCHHQPGSLAPNLGASLNCQLTVHTIFLSAVLHKFLADKVGKLG